MKYLQLLSLLCITEIAMPQMFWHARMHAQTHTRTQTPAPLLVQSMPMAFSHIFGKYDN